MARKPQDEEKGGLPGWMGTYGDLVTLLLCFFVLLFAMSTVDVNKFKAAMSSFSDQIDVLPGGIALTGEELITNGISQLNEIAVILENRNPTIESTDDVGTDPDQTDDSGNPGDVDLEEMTEEEAQAYYLELAQDFADEVAQDFLNELTSEGLETEVEIDATPNYVVLTIKGKALFDLGDAIIKPEAEQIIAVIARTYEEDYEQYNLMIEGHTDDKPINTLIYPSNWYLSAARAIAVGEYLIEQVGIPDEKISCTGYGEFQPIDDNNTEEGAANNRRVVIKINLGGVDQFIEKDTILDDPTGDGETELNNDTAETP